MFATLFNVEVDACTAFPNICGANATIQTDLTFAIARLVTPATVKLAPELVSV